MLVSLKELNKYVDISDLSAKDIAKGLTFAGIEVEEIKPFASGTNLVIGEIKELEKHKDSDHLNVLQVDLGPKYGLTQIVCGAPNARKGLKVIVSRVGAKLPLGEIKASKIRGVDSFGMCCSLLELGVEEKYLSEYSKKGIEELSNDAIVGNENVLSYLGLDDTILNISVLANRPDLLSIYNVAKEVGAIFKRSVHIPEYSLKPSFLSTLNIKINTPSCSSFSILEVRGIKVKPSPKWLINVLNSLGVRSINNIVDIGNYVMLLTGQPLHIYDKEKLIKKELIIKDDYVGDFIALDNNKYQIIKGDISICSNDKIMCLGGVMGSIDASVIDKTQNIYIESASFNGVQIRHTSSRLGLISESSMRFVKGINRYQSQSVLSLTYYLLKELADAKDCSNILSVGEKYYDPISISSSAKYINDRLGTSFTYEQIVSTLKSLNIMIKDIDSNHFIAYVPPYRLDLNSGADLSEEVIRLLGLENIKSQLPFNQMSLGGRSNKQKRLKAISDFLLDNGVDECITYSLVNEKQSKEFNLLNDEENIKLLNPLTKDHEYLRTHILDSLLNVTSYNINRQNKDLSIFEIANCYSKVSSSVHLGVIFSGRKFSQGKLNPRNYDFYDMKGLVEALFSLLNIEESRYRFVKNDNSKNLLHPYRSANIIFQNQKIGSFGEVFPTINKIYDLGKNNKVIVLEMDLSSLIEAKVSTIKVNNISRFPSVSRDLAIVLDKEIEANELIKTIKSNGKGIIKSASIFDVYEGNNLKEGQKSVAINIIFNSDNHTLNDNEINNVIEQLKFILTKNFKGEIRSF